MLARSCGGDELTRGVFFAARRKPCSYYFDNGSLTGITPLHKQS
jgi:hypothetical protein